jgi:hypothetical protein
MPAVYIESFRITRVQSDRNMKLCTNLHLLETLGMGIYRYMYAVSIKFINSLCIYIANACTSPDEDRLQSKYVVSSKKNKTGRFSNINLCGDLSHDFPFNNFRFFSYTQYNHLYRT